MKHYGITVWVDHTRGLLPEDLKVEMTSHLEDGCPECQELADFCARLGSVCNELAAMEVPEWLTRNARAIFPVQHPEPRRRAIRIPVELIYDSFLAPAPAGLRATWQTGWQALYRAGDCSLDLRVEPELHSSRAAVIGQISNHAAPGSRMEGIAVYLKAGRSVVAETRSNAFGEFQLEYQQQARLQLCVDIDNGSKRFQLPLKKLASDRTTGGDSPALPAEPNRETE
jgi:hypothetical protein